MNLKLFFSEGQVITSVFDRAVRFFYLELCWTGKAGKYFFYKFLKQKGSVTLVKDILLLALETYCTEQLNLRLKKFLWFYDCCYPSSHVLSNIVRFGCSADSHNCSVYFFKLDWVVEGYFAYLLLAFVARNFMVGNASHEVLWCVTSLYKCSSIHLLPRLSFHCPTLSYGSQGTCDFLTSDLLVKTEVKRMWDISAFSMSFVTRLPALFSSRPTFSLIILLPFLSLTTFKSKWALVFPTSIFACLNSLFVFPLGCLSTLPALRHLLFMLGSQAPYSSCKLPAIFAWFHACQDGSFLSLEESIFENQPVLVHSSPRLFSVALYQADLWMGKSLLSWSPGLLLSCSLLSGSWTSTSYHCN